jgi:hypothetical protein
MLEFRDRPPSGWFVVHVMRRKRRGRDWVALLIDTDPDDFPRSTPSAECLVRIPGKHRNLEGACDALDDLMATRH